MNVSNETTGKELAGNAVLADTFFSRLKGLLGRSALAAGDGLLIKPCKGIHTIGMRFPIDVVFLDERNIVVACKKGLAPNRLTPLFPRATSVLELPDGMIDATGTGIGDQIEIA